MPHFDLIGSRTLRSPAPQNWDFRHISTLMLFPVAHQCFAHCGTFAILWQSLRYPTLTTAGRLTILRIWTHRQCKGIYRMDSPQVVYLHEGKEGKKRGLNSQFLLFGDRKIETKTFKITRSSTCFLWFTINLVKVSIISSLRMLKWANFKQSKARMNAF